MLTEDWVLYFLQRAYNHGLRSKDPSSTCGAVLVDPLEKRAKMDGFNGFPSCIEDKLEYYSDRSIKYPLTVHAETNAIIHYHGPKNGMYLFSSLPPCKECAKLIAAVGISSVYYVQGSYDFLDRWSEEIKVANFVFDLAGIRVGSYPLDTVLDFDPRRQLK